MLYFVSITECGNAFRYESRHRALAPHAALAMAVSKHFGRGARFVFDAGFSGTCGHIHKPDSAGELSPVSGPVQILVNEVNPLSEEA
jgi:hypothetical protein